MKELGQSLQKHNRSIEDARTVTLEVLVKELRRGCGQMVSGFPLLVELRISCVPPAARWHNQRHRAGARRHGIRLLEIADRALGTPPECAQ